MSRHLEYMKETLACCFLPQLKRDLDGIPIQTEDFAEFHIALRTTLPVFYDFIQQNKQWIFECHVQDAETQQVQAQLFLFLCELTAPLALYKLEDEHLISNANKLLKTHAVPNDSVENLMFKYYQVKLQKDCWKRQLGAVHGFLRFLEWHFAERGASAMARKWLTFVLSVGLIIRECADPRYNQMGIRIFVVILNCANFDDIRNMNIHSVIFDSALKDVYFLKSVEAIEEAWTCLYKCLAFFRNIDSFTWNAVDDLIEILVRNVSLASDCDVAGCLLRFISRLGYYFTINREEIEAKFKEDLEDPVVCQEFRRLCSENSSYTVYRWAKTILNTFTVSAYRLMLSPKVCRQLLVEMHRCYMVYVLPIALAVIEAQLMPFYEKFTATLVEVIVAQKRDAQIVKLVKSVLETFCVQLQHSVHCNEKERMVEYREAFEELLRHSIFA